MTVLVGAHSIGYARCASFRSHIYKDTNIDPLFASTRRIICPRAGGDNNIAAFDNSVITFDNDYYRGLVDRHGLLHSDQEFFNNGTQDGLVRNYSKDNNAWRKDFVESIVKMGNINVLTGTNGEIRKNCRLRN
ncbi:PREDICTED: peroxidase-like [Fragaria vesca subsp. vesca]|uniref:peroxidase-like n=1 Tax=Fragaria vesca subsp. vesca TaxID=101020 RepID=UPI0002C30653|nr:PREDICTED: peroxidase-like [Fragaria vesca subsp. vesca]